MGERSENLFVISNSKKFLVVGGWVSCLGTIPWPQSQKDWPKQIWHNLNPPRPHVYAQSRRSTSWQHFQCSPDAIKFLPEVTGRRPNRGRAWPPPAPFCDTLNILKSGSVHDYTFRLLHISNVNLRNSGKIIFIYSAVPRFVNSRICKRFC